MMQRWEMQEAQDNFSKVVDDAIQVGPQVITRQGDKMVIVLSYAEYQKLIMPQEKLSDFFRNSPLADTELDLRRDKSLPTIMDQVSDNAYEHGMTSEILDSLLNDD